MAKSFIPELSLLRWQKALHLGENRLFMLLAIGTGLVAGLVAVLYHLLLDWLFTHLYGGSDLHAGLHWRYLVFLGVGATIASLVMEWLPQSRGSGVAHTKIAILVHDGYIPLRSTIGKFLASGVGIGSGQAMGPEGPAVHIGAGVASVIGRLSSLPKRKIQQLVPVGAAAGLAAVFNAPITAVLFVLEEVIGDLNTPMLGSTIIAAVMAVMVSRWFLGNGPLFHVPQYEFGGARELPAFAALGLVGGMASVAFTGSLVNMRRHFLRRSGPWRRWLPVAGALVVGLIAFAFPQVLGVGYHYVNAVLNDRMAVSLMLWLVLAKMAATAICYATGNAGGIFAPSLYIGAMLGGGAGALVHLGFPNYHASAIGAYALVGMGVMFAGINRTPITSIFMIFEVTQDYNLILPLMIANVIAFAVATRLQGEGIYELLAAQDGVHLPSRHSRIQLQRLTNGDAMEARWEGLPAHLTAEQALQRLQADNDGAQNAFPVLAERDFVGLVSRAALLHAVADHQGEQTLGQMAHLDPELRVFPDESLETTLHLLGRGADLVPVLSRLDGRTLLGVLTTADVMRAFGVAEGRAQGSGPAAPPPQASVETRL